MQKQNGFTLIELMLVTAITAMIVVTITGMFFRSIRSGAKTDTLIAIDQNAQYVLNLMERFIKNAKSVESSCPTVSNTLTVLNWDGGSTTFSLMGDKVASNSAVISQEGLLVENLSFECIRIEGIPDQIKISFDVSLVDVGGGASSAKSYETVVNLRNY